MLKLVAFRASQVLMLANLFKKLPLQHLCSLGKNPVEFRVRQDNANWMSPHILHFYELGVWYDSCTQTTKSMSHWLVMHVWNKENKNHMQCFTLDLLCTAAGEIFTHLSYTRPVWPQWAAASSSAQTAVDILSSEGHTQCLQDWTLCLQSDCETPQVLPVSCWARAPRGTGETRSDSDTCWSNWKNTTINHSHWRNLPEQVRPQTL